MWDDLRSAFRRLRRRPALLGVAGAILGLGLGGATALFSVADTVVLRPLPYAEADRLVLFWQRDRPRNQAFVEMSYPAFRDFRAANPAFSALAGMPSTNQEFLWTDGPEPLPLTGRLVTGDFFAVLGVPPRLGRVFGPEDDRPGAPPVVVLGHSLWRDRFGADPEVVGRRLTLSGQGFEVVGVMPEGFDYPRGASLWTPLVPGVGAIAEDPTVFWMSALGRLKEGVDLEEARQGMASLVLAYNREHYRMEGTTAVLTPLSDSLLGSARPALLALLGAVLLVLLVAGVNVAGLLVVDLVERRGELAVRQALGASAGNLRRALFAEALLIASLGGVIGLSLAFVLTPALVALAPADVPRLERVTVDARALIFGLAATLGTAFLCALVPAGLLGREPLEETLRTKGRGTAPGRSRLRAGLVVGEIAAALALLVGAGLLGRTFLALRSAPLGYRAEGLLSFDLPLPAEHDAPAKRRAFCEETLRRVRALPGVASAATVTLRPLWGTVGMDWPYALEGQSEEEAAHNPLVNFETVSPAYFETMGIPLRRGRAFSETDTEGQPGVVVLGESLAKAAWRGQDPLGRRMKLPLPGTPYDGQWLTVVGVVADARYREIHATRGDLYMPLGQSDHRPRHLMVRARGDGDPLALAPAVRDTLRAAAPGLPATTALPMTDAVASALAAPRFAARLFAAFATLALLLAALGLYGLLAFAVSRRTREVGVRAALGASPCRVAGLVVREGLALAAAGAGLGLAVAAMGSRLLSSLLHEVRPLDPVSFALGAGVLTCATLAACLLPALAAARVDPAVALRSE
jgi:predicted permease